MPLAEHDRPRNVCSYKIRVSIHVPLAEHDDHHAPPVELQQGVSIHVPLAEHDMAYVTINATQLVSIHVPLAEHDGQRLSHL